MVFTFHSQVTMRGLKNVGMRAKDKKLPLLLQQCLQEKNKLTPEQSRLVRRIPSHG